MSHRRQAGPSQERPTLPSWRQLTLAGQEQEDAARQTLREEPSDASESTSTISDSSEDLRYIVRQPRTFTDAKRAAERPEDHRNPQGPIAQYNPGDAFEAKCTQISSISLHLPIHHHMNKAGDCCGLPWQSIMYLYLQ